MGSRIHNEQKFGRWQDLANGGRCYQLEVPGKTGGRAVYLKQVDENEETLRFWQEIYDEFDVLVEIHEKYPVDTGHLKV